MKSIMLLLTALLLSVAGISQTITLQAPQLPFKQLFSAVEKQTGYVVFYNVDLLKKTKPVTVSVKDMPLESFLQTVMANQPIDYEISNKTITIKEKPAAAVTHTPAGAVHKDPPVTGLVKDSKGNILSNASVTISGTNTAVVTNEKGVFSIEANTTHVLIVSFIGYENKVISLKNAELPLQVTLTASQKNMNEVVVIGYGTVAKRDLTGAVTTVNTQDLNNIPATRIDQMLQGRIAGAEIVSTDGEPGSGTSIRIRGTRSISASNEPLYIVDGLMDAVNSLNEINPSDVASIEVLKDAASTAIYGSRGSNGVIIITTKSGSDKRGKTAFTLHTDAGYSELPRYLDLMNATEFAQLQNDRFYFSSTANQTKPLEEYPFPNPLAMGDGTNWTKEISRKAPFQNISLSAAGGDKATQYYFSTNFNNNQGIVMNSGLKRYQTRLNLDRTINEYVKAGVRINYSIIDRALNNADIGTNTLWYRSTIFLAPTIAAYKPDGSFNDWNTQWYSGTLFDSPIANALLRKNDQKEKNMNAMAYIEIKPFKNSTAKSTLSYSDYNSNWDQYTPGTMPSRRNANTGGYAYKRSYTVSNLLNENTISYKKSWNKAHNFDALYGFTIQVRKFSNMNVSGSGYYVDDNEMNDLGAVPSKETISLGSSLEDQARVSHLTRLNYNYKGKYYLTATARADGASNFASNNKWGFFPSAAFKWNVTREPFMQNIRAIDELSVRLSGGSSGNDAIARYQSQPRLTATTGGYIFNGTQPVAYYPSRIENGALSWERTASYNAGLDLSLLNKRLDITLDVYKSLTTDLLLTVQLPTQVGYDNRLANIGKTSNKGIELSVSYDIIRSKNFKWTSTVTAATNKQRVEDIGGLDRVAVYTNQWGAFYMMYGYEKGRPLNSLWGMQYGGTWKNQDEIAKDKIDKKYASSAVSFYSPGRPRYIDQNNDGTLDNQDLVYLGNADPDIYGGLMNSFTIKKLTVSFYVNYSLGGKIYNPVENFMGSGTYSTNQFRYMVNAWHPIRNPNSDYPRADSRDDIPNDRFVHNASFLRFKNFTIGYPFNLAKLTNQKIQSLTLSFSGNNVFLWKYYNGYDPEVSTQSDGSTMRRMDNGAYPSSRTITFGAELKF